MFHLHVNKFTEASPLQVLLDPSFENLKSKTLSPNKCLNAAEPLHPNFIFDGHQIQYHTKHEIMIIQANHQGGKNLQEVAHPPYGNHPIRSLNLHSLK